MLKEARMHPQFTQELAAQRRDELLHEADQARSVAQARSPHTPWRSAAGFVLVRLGMRLAGRACDNPVVVVRRLHDGEQAAVAVIWNKLDNAA